MAKQTIIVLPQIKKDDELYGIFYLPQWMYKNKYLRIICYCCPLLSAVYLCQFLHCAITDWKNMISVDILLATLCLLVALNAVSILDEEKTVLELKQLRVEYFWDNNFLSNREKREFNRNVNTYVFLQHALWVISVFVVIASFTAPYFPQSLSNENWSYLKKFVVRLYGYLYLPFAYYVGMTHESFFVYTVLHGYLQMKTLTAYLRQEFCRPEKIDVKEKIYSYKYQTLIAGVLLRCIKQHKTVATYGTKIINIYNKWMIFHSLGAVTALWLGFYCYIFDPSSCGVSLSIGTLHFALIGIYYQLTGQLYSDGYEDFYKELLNVKWYQLNKNKQKIVLHALNVHKKEI